MKHAEKPMFSARERFTRRLRDGDPSREVVRIEPEPAATRK